MAPSNLHTRTQVPEYRAAAAETSLRYSSSSSSSYKLPSTGAAAFSCLDEQNWGRGVSIYIYTCLPACLLAFFALLLRRSGQKNCPSSDMATTRSSGTKYSRRLRSRSESACCTPAQFDVERLFACLQYPTPVCDPAARPGFNLMVSHT